MNTTLDFVTLFDAVLKAEKFETQPHQVLEGTGIVASFYGRRKNFHYFVFDLEQTLKGNLDRLTDAHEAACKWVNSQYKTPKALRFQAPIIQSILVTAEPFTKAMQEKVLAQMDMLAARSAVGGEVSNVTLVDLPRRTTAPLKAVQMMGWAIQKKVQKMVEDQVQTVFQQLPGTAEVSEEPEMALETAPKSRVSPWPPSWAWFFIVLCALIIGFRGAIPSAIGAGAAAGCYQVSRDRSQPTQSRVLKCLGITVGAWVTVLVIAFLIAMLFSR
jgi:F0F1-type ATP synthase membrane subunit c/vacuolar-type H+-ATPase subunit K